MTQSQAIEQAWEELLDAHLQVAATYLASIGTPSEATLRMLLAYSSRTLRTAAALLPPPKPLGG